ncbi:hypothetical protein BU17DRAFT_76813 [Hysterangium stoloniferum]|nr:hypothetical protein BU17DRAFT_76813 [Hysterangium stoloniferum]
MLSPSLSLESPPEKFNFAADVIDVWARNPKLKAMIWTDPRGSRKDVTFKQLSDRSHLVAKWMSEQLAIKKGDRIIIIVPRLVEWWEILLGALRIGAVLIPCTTLLTPKDIEYRIRVSGARAFIGDESALEKFNKLNDIGRINVKVLVNTPSGRNVPGWHPYHQGLDITGQAGDHYQGPDILAKETSIIYFTSGTSGPPKMVVHNQISYPLGHVITGRHWYQLAPGKILWSLTELGWAKVAWCTFGCWSMGATLFVQDDRGAFNPATLIKTLHDYGITTFCAPPTVYRYLVLKENQKLMEKYKPSALQHCTTAGEALNPYVFETWKQMTGLEIHEGYGQTETTLVCGGITGSAIRLGSMGQAVPGVPLGVIDDAGNELPADVEGDIAICISTPFPWMFDGYLKEDGSVEVPEIVNAKTGQRWYSTGDRATRDKDGYFFFVGRADDVIKTSGYRVGPFEIESCLKEHEAVAESAVVASPDPQRGDIVKAFIVLTDLHRKSRSKDLKLLANELEKFVALNTAPYKKPREIEFVDALPKTISGKVRRVELRAMEKQRKSSLAKL